eukprot:jgi/Undpi1/10825/HiC_scaffold_3.g01354.m1
MNPRSVKPAASLMEAELTTAEGGGTGGEDGGRWLFSGAVISLTWTALTEIIAPVITVIIICVVTSERRVWRRLRLPTRENLPVRDKLAVVAESHLSTSRADRALLRESLRVLSERHPHLRDLTAAYNATSEVEGEEGQEDGREEEEEEEEGRGGGKGKEAKGEGGNMEEEEDVKVLENELAEAFVESRRLAREDLIGTRTSSSDLHNALQTMREKLAVADEPEIILEMQKEFLEEMEALAETDISVAKMFGGSSVGMVELLALMAKSFGEQREKSNREATKIKDEANKQLAAILQSKPGKGLPAESTVEQLIAAIKVKRREEARDLQTFVRQAAEEIAASEGRVQDYRDRCAAATRSLEAEKKYQFEFKKKDDAVLDEMREYVSRAPALIHDIGEANSAIAAAKKHFHILVRKERKLTSELAEQRK